MPAVFTDIKVSFNVSTGSRVRAPWCEARIISRRLNQWIKEADGVQSGRQAQFDKAQAISLMCQRAWRDYSGAATPSSHRAPAAKRSPTWSRCETRHSIASGH